MLEVARKDQRVRAQRLCNLASYERIKYRLPDGDLKTTRINGHRWYFVIGEMGPSYRFWYGLRAQNGSYAGDFPATSIISELGGVW